MSSVDKNHEHYDEFDAVRTLFYCLFLVKDNFISKIQKPIAKYPIESLREKNTSLNDLVKWKYTSQDPAFILEVKKAYVLPFYQENTPNFKAENSRYLTKNLEDHQEDINKYVDKFNDALRSIFSTDSDTSENDNLTVLKKNEDGTLQFPAFKKDTESFELPFNVNIITKKTDAKKNYVFQYNKQMEYAKRVVGKFEKAFKKKITDITSVQKSERSDQLNITDYLKIPRSEDDKGPKFVGRKEELKDLKSFAKSDSKVSIIQIAGAVGTGKTTLAIQLCKDLNEGGRWDAGFLTADDMRKLLQKIEDWKPEKNTLIVIDGLLGMESQVDTLLGELEKKDTTLKFLLLIIERVSLFSADSLQIEVGQYFKSISQNSLIEKLKLVGMTLELGVMGIEDLIQIVRKNIDSNDSEELEVTDEEIGSRFDLIDNSKNPLIAALLGIYWHFLDNKDDSSRSNLLKLIVRKDNSERVRKSLIYGKATAEEREAALTLAAIATILHDIEVPKLILARGFIFTKRTVRELAAEYTRSIDSGIIIAAYDKGLLGIWFVFDAFDTVGWHVVEDALLACWHIEPNKTLNFLRELVDKAPYRWESDFLLSRSIPPEEVFDNFGLQWYGILGGTIKRCDKEKIDGFVESRTLFEKFYLVGLTFSVLWRHNAQEYWVQRHNSKVCRLYFIQEAAKSFRDAMRADLPIIPLLHQSAFSLLTEKFSLPINEHDFIHNHVEKKKLYLAQSIFSLINQYDESNEACIGLGVIAYLLGDYNLAFSQFKKGMLGDRKWRFRRGPFYDIDKTDCYSARKIIWIWADLCVHFSEFKHVGLHGNLSPHWVFENNYTWCPRFWLANVIMVVTSYIRGDSTVLRMGQYVSNVSDKINRERSTLRALEDEDISFSRHVSSRFADLLVKSFECGHLKLTLMLFGLLINIRRDLLNSLLRTPLIDGRDCLSGPFAIWDAYTNYRYYPDYKELGEVLSDDKTNFEKKCIEQMREKSKASDKTFFDFIEDLKKLETEIIDEFINSLEIIDNTKSPIHDENEWGNNLSMT